MTTGRVADERPAGSVGRRAAGRVRAILAELLRRKVVRTANAPAGDYAEWLVARALGGTIADSRSAKSWDIRLPDGDLVQVKCRLVTDPPSTGQLQTSPFRSFDFAWAAFVMLDSATYEVRRAALVPAANVEAVASRREHVNGSVVQMRPELLASAGARDITAALQQATQEHDR